MMSTRDVKVQWVFIVQVALWHTPPSLSARISLDQAPQPRHPEKPCDRLSNISKIALYRSISLCISFFHPTAAPLETTYQVVLIVFLSPNVSCRIHPRHYARYHRFTIKGEGDISCKLPSKAGNRSPPLAKERGSAFSTPLDSIFKCKNGATPRPRNIRQDDKQPIRWVYIVPPWGGFPRSIARQPRGCQC